MPKKFNALIIGAGKIGAFFDSPKDKNILTHAHAYCKHPGFKIVGFFDSDYKRAEKASEIWGGRAFKDLEEAFGYSKIDIVSVCVPDDFHFSVLKELKKYEILGGIIEKPLTTSLKDSRVIIRDKFFKNRLFLVNYMRRFLPEFQRVRKKIVSGKYGRFLSGTINYGKGLLHNGSHLVDLLDYFGFSIEDSIVTDDLNDFYSEDHSYSAILHIGKRSKINLNAFPASNYRIFEMDLIFEKGRVKILEDGSKIEEYEIVNDQVFKGYRILKLVEERRPDLSRVLYHTIAELYRMLLNKDKATSLLGAYEIQKICQRIKDSNNQKDAKK